MFNIGKNGVITITRGDTITLPLYINIGTALEPVLYPMVTGDKLYFGIMEPNQLFEQAIVKKVFNATDYDLANHCVRVKLTSKDTEYLIPGTYYYMAKLTRQHSLVMNNGVQTMDEELVDTIIPKTKFIILE